jgi:hypothetical protein
MCYRSYSNAYTIVTEYLTALGNILDHLYQEILWSVQKYYVLNLYSS